MTPPNIRLTLRTLLAYLDDTLEPAQALVIGQKLAESKPAQELADRIRKITRKRGLSVPSAAEGQGTSSDPNTVAAYLSDALPSEQLAEFEQICLESDVHLAEVAASHQILTLVMSEQIRIPPTAYRRMYGLVTGPASIPNRNPAATMALGAAVESAADDRDDLDTTYLLGLAAYSKSQPVGLRVLKWLAVAALFVGFILAAFMVWPRSKDHPVEIAKRPDTTTSTTKPAETAPTTTTHPTTPSTSPTTVPTAPMPVPIPVVPMPTPMVEPPPVRPELVAKVPEVIPGRIAVATYEPQDDQILLAQKTEGVSDTWQRVAPKAEVMSTERLICLPGYRAKIKYETGLIVELWANMPELIPIPVLQTAITPTIAEAGFDADITFHVGRLFLSTAKPGGAKVRVRFRKEIWEIALPDAKTEVALEVMHAPTPGPLMETPVTWVVLFANAGTPTLATRNKEATKIPTRQLMLWTSTGKGLEGPRSPDTKKREPGAEYFDRLPIYPDEASATATRKVLDGFAKRLPEAKSLSALLAEKNLGAANGTTADDLYGARFAIFSWGALGNFERLAEAASDPQRPFAREAALVALRAAFASDPSGEAVFRTAAEAKFRLSKPQLDSWLRRLPGLTPAERVDIASLDQLVADLSAPEIVQRELAFHVLLNDLDPEARKTKLLASYDAGAPTEVRDFAVKAWKKRVEELKTAIREMPVK
jgi:hypothetical protein